MGVCISWTLSKKIAPEAWAKVVADFRLAANAFPAWVDERRQMGQKSLSIVGRAAQSLFGVNLLRPYPRPGVASFEWGSHGDQSLSDRIEIRPSPDDAGQVDVTPWIFSRHELSGSVKTNAAIHGDLLLALLAIVHDRCPGQLMITQNDYAETGHRFEMAYTEDFVHSSLERRVLFPSTDTEHSSPARPKQPSNDAASTGPKSTGRRPGPH